MNNFCVFVASLAVISSAKCGIIDRGFETFGDAAHLAQEGAADMFSTGKEILFGKGIRAGPDPVDQGIFPGFAHKIGDGFHLLGAGMSHVFAGDDDIHSPLSVMKDKLAHGAAGVSTTGPVGALPSGVGVLSGGVEATRANIPVPPAESGMPVGDPVVPNP